MRRRLENLRKRRRLGSLRRSSLGNMRRRRLGKLRRKRLGNARRRKLGNLRRRLGNVRRRKLGSLGDVKRRVRDMCIRWLEVVRRLGAMWKRLLSTMYHTGLSRLSGTTFMTSLLARFH